MIAAVEIEALEPPDSTEEIELEAVAWGDGADGDAVVPVETIELEADAPDAVAPADPHGASWDRAAASRPAADPCGILVLCHALAALPSTGWGMLVVGDAGGAELGGVFVHEGRVCGAIGPDARLAQGTQPSRRALLRRTAAAVAALGVGATRRWSPGTGQGFEPRVTFSVAEVLVAALAVHARRANRAARAIQMAPWPARDAIVLAYAVDHGSDLLLPIAMGGDVPLGVRAVLDLGKVGQDALIAAGCLNGLPQLVLARVSANAAIAAWADLDVLFVARVTGPAAVERMLHGWRVMQDAR